MASWGEIESQAPELAARARAILDSHAHKTIATLRRDGSPRISGIEIEFAEGDLWIGSMWNAVKALDLRRDGRFALHSNSWDPGAERDNPGAQRGDAKLAGRMVEVTDPEREGRSHRFRADIAELVVIRVAGKPPELLIESWHPGRGLTLRKR
jgi:hypothetical protein